MGDITWLIFTVLSWKLLCKEWPSIQASSQHTSHSLFNLSAWSNEWLQNTLRGASQGAQSSVPCFSNSAFALTFFDLGLICDQQLCTSCHHNWRDAAYSGDPPWNNEGERSEAKLNTSTTQLECYWCLGEIAYYLQEINIGDFKCSLTKIILRLLLCAWGQQLVKDSSWHIRSSGRFSGLQIRASQNNTWKRQQIQWKVSRHPEGNHWAANFKSGENSENHCVILWLKDSYGCGECGTCE